jgi:hypothetical protein
MDRHQHFEAPPEPEDELLSLNPEHYFAEDFGTMSMWTRDDMRSYPFLRID